MSVIIEYPREWTEEAFEAAVSTAEARPLDDPNRDDAIAGARRNLATYHATARASMASLSEGDRALLTNLESLLRTGRSKPSGPV